MLTFHRCINYGSYWQARCLSEGIRARGDEVRILDHVSRRIADAEWRCALRPVPSARARALDALRYAVKGFRFARARSALPRSPRFPLEEPERMEAYDQVVVGSDEVWNPSHPWYGRCALFFGRGVRAGRLLSYAASFGNHDAGAGLERDLADGLRDFSAISVRDENSRRIVASVMGMEPDVVLDPCLQFPLAPEGRWRGPRDRFVAVYGHSFGETFGNAVRGWARDRGYRLLSLGYRNDWADLQWLAAGPHDFAHALARAEAVATNFFHGCVFALLNGKPFVCETMPYRANKILGLLSVLGAEAHRIVGEPDRNLLVTRLSEPPLPGVLREIDRLRAASDAFLTRALA